MESGSLFRRIYLDPYCLCNSGLSGFFLGIVASLLGTGSTLACNTHGVWSYCLKVAAPDGVVDRRFFIHWRWAYFIFAIILLQSININLRVIIIFKLIGIMLLILLYRGRVEVSSEGWACLDLAG